MYKQSDFNKCLFNPFSEDLVLDYPQLKVITKISGNITTKLLRYIISVYDYQSPIVYKNRDLKTRKQQGAEFAGYDLAADNGILKGIMNLEIDYVLWAVDAFLKEFIHSRTWYMICTNESIFWEYGQRMLMPVSEKAEGGKPMSEKDLISAMQAKTKLSEDMQGLDDRLDAAYKKLYGDENSNKFINRATTPETIARERHQSSYV